MFVSGWSGAQGDPVVGRRVGLLTPSSRREGVSHRPGTEPSPRTGPDPHVRYLTPFGHRTVARARSAPLRPSREIRWEN